MILCRFPQLYLHFEFSTMNHMSRFLLFIFIVSIHFCSCGSNSETPTNSPSNTGKLYGTMALIDSAYAPAASWAGILVEIPGTALSTKTDSLGRWSFELPI